jgi:hypothetical protein
MSIPVINQHIELVTVPEHNAVEKSFLSLSNLEHLISQCDPNAPMPTIDAEWEAMPPVGNELL